jgi:hypothetical protein
MMERVRVTLAINFASLMTLVSAREFPFVLNMFPQSSPTIWINVFRGFPQSFQTCRDSSFHILCNLLFINNPFIRRYVDWVTDSVYRAVAQAVFRRLFIAEGLVRFQVGPCGISGGQSGTGTGSSPSH